jgi:hypothetical protein
VCTFKSTSYAGSLRDHKVFPYQKGRGEEGRGGEGRINLKKPDEKYVTDEKYAMDETPREVSMEECEPRGSVSVSKSEVAKVNAQ